MLKPGMLHLKTPKNNRFNKFLLFIIIVYIYLKIMYKISKKCFKSSLVYTYNIDINNNTSQKRYEKYYQNMKYFKTFCFCLNKLNTIKYVDIFSHCTTVENATAKLSHSDID